MPILAREADLFPDDLLEREEWDDESQSWWAVYTRSRHEKQLMRRLKTISVPFYCPLIEQRSKSPSGRIRKSWMPLFSNYVFVYGDDEARYNMMTTNCVSRTVVVEDAVTLVRDLRSIRGLIDVGAPVTIESKIEPGEAVRVKTGTFVGREGVVIRRKGKSRLVVAVNFLQQGASVELEDCELERI